MPARRAISLAVQLARGLGAAHAAGIVHRDFKPENVIVCGDGRAKIVDFGLARVVRDPAIDSSVAPTAAAATLPGTVLGTVGYMAPEQVRAQESDGLADLFALGTVACEMITGKRAFRGSSPADSVSAILREEPAGLAEVQPLALRRILAHCLEKSLPSLYRHCPRPHCMSATTVTF